MAISVGTRLGPYEVASAIGAGGMGEVYRARDTRLDRTVAIKVLSSRVTASPELKQRFEREARTISSLQHPHTLFDVGSQDGLDYLVMEYLDGETLADRLRKGPLPLEQVGQIGIEIADALGAAHRQGIVHRDLKPGNIMLTRSGAKLMDFGLAKPTASIAASASAPNPATPSSPTMSLAELTNPASPLTSKGTIMGTSQYMAPEVLRGQDADARSDIFSFGCVLYEMATGRRAFEGKSQLSILTAILEKEPEPLSNVRAMAPPLLDRIVMQCLAKDPEQRLQNALDIAAGLRWVSDVPAAVAVPERRRRVALLPAAIALLVVAGLAAGATWWTLQSRTKPFTGPVLTRLTSDAGLSTDPALSRDARLAAFASDRSGAGDLDIWVKQTAGGEPLRLTRDSADDYEPDFSPDGSTVAFRSDRAGGGIYLVSALGGDARLIAREGRRPKFSPDGKWILYWIGDPTSGNPSAPGASQIVVVAATGGAGRQLAADFPAASYPFWAPDSKHVFFTGYRPKETDLYVAPLDSGTAIATGVTALARGSSPLRGNVVAATDRPVLIYSAKTGDAYNLWELAYSQATWKAAGPPRRLTFGTGDDHEPAPAPGRLAFATATERANVWMLPLDANAGKVTGELRSITHADALHGLPSVSEDGQKVVYLANDTNLRLLDLKTGTDSLLYATQRPNFIHRPLISPDGSRVAYRERSGDKNAPFVLSTSGGVPEKIAEEAGTTQGWSRDNNRIFTNLAGPLAAIGALDLRSRTTTLLLQHPTFPLWQPQTSPDDRWLLFLATTGPNRSRLYAAPNRGAKIPVEEWIPITDGQSRDDKPRWSPNGNLIYFTSERDGFRCIWAQRVDPVTRHPRDPSFPVAHFHSARRSMMNIPYYPLEISVARDKLVFNLSERTSNLWMMGLE